MNIGTALIIAGVLIALALAIWALVRTFNVKVKNIVDFDAEVEAVASNHKLGVS
jgi:uncharacterized membrane protein